MSDIPDLFTLLPDVNFVDTDTEATEERIITVYEGIANTVLYPGDPVRLFLSTLAAVITQLRVDINNTGRMNLLRYARGSFLDHIGALVGCYRTDAMFATTQLLFNLQLPVSFDFIIPQGTRVTSEGDIYFATDEDVTIVSGGTIGMVSATCLTAGIAGNGLLPGQINLIVDPLPYVTEVTNTTESSGGADEELDDSFRLRIALAPEGFSVAGPVLAYEYWTRTAHSAVADVSVYSPVPGTVRVLPLLTGGVIPDPSGAEIAAIIQVLNDQQHRPLCDTVVVEPPTAIYADYIVKWFITGSQIGYQSTIAAAVDTAVQEYEAWQRSSIGRAINPDVLIQKCRGAGVWRIELTGLDYTPLGRDQVAQFVINPDRIQFGGVEEF